MTADFLREAATTLRTLAGAATPGPWWTHHTEGELWFGDEALTRRLDSDPDAASEYDWERWSEHTGSLFHGDVVHKPDAAYIAAMHPGVGLLLADWLDAEAQAHFHTADGPRALYDQPNFTGPALAVARAVLGRES